MALASPEQMSVLCKTYTMMEIKKQGVGSKVLSTLTLGSSSDGLVHALYSHIHALCPKSSA